MAIRTASPVEDRGKSAVETLKGAAELLRDAADTGEKIIDAVHAAGRQLHAFADYLSSHRARNSVDRGKGFVKRHPLESVIAVAVVGFLLGRTISKR